MQQNSGVMSKEQVKISLKYEGPDVEDGTMSVEDIVPILQGFASAYGTVAKIHDPNSTHDLRIVDVRPGSADIVLDVLHFVDNNMMEIVRNTGTGIACFIFKKIIDVIKTKKHVKNKKHTVNIIGDNNNVVVINSSNESLDMNRGSYGLFDKGKLDRPLDRITSPLQEGRIHSAEIQAESFEGEVLHEKIELPERIYFRNEDKEETSTEDKEETSTMETWLEVQLNSLTKSTNNRYLHLSDKTRVAYSYKGDFPEKLYQIFGTHNDLVRIKCIAYLDENLKITRVDIFDIEPHQGEPFTNPGAEDGD